METQRKLKKVHTYNVYKPCMLIYYVYILYIYNIAFRWSKQ